MTITLNGSNLTIEKLVAIARDGEKVALDPAALERIKVCRAMLEDKLAKKEIMYGTNTGIGEFSETMLNDEQVKEFQKYLVYNHAAGIGDPAPIEHVRAALAGRINVHAHGNSGCRPEITLTMVEMLNKGVTPVVCQKGSVGASGDLAPMAQAALLLWAKGKPSINGERLPGKEAMERAGIPIPGLQARDGLAAINGSNLLTAMSAIHIYDMERFIKQAEIAAAMSLEALLANLKPYDTRLHELRGFKGAIASASKHPQGDRRLRPDHGQDEDQGAGRLLDAFHAAGDRRGARCHRLCPLAGGDRAQRRRRQPHLHPRGAAHVDRRQLPGQPGRPADGHGGRGHHHGVCALRAPPQPPDQPGAKRRACLISWRTAPASTPG